MATTADLATAYCTIPGFWQWLKLTKRIKTIRTLIIICSVTSILMLIFSTWPMSGFAIMMMLMICYLGIYGPMGEYHTYYACEIVKISYEFKNEDYLRSIGEWRWDKK